MARATPDPKRAALYESLVEDAFDFMVAIRADFTVEYASTGITRLLGEEPRAYVDRSAADFVHPDDLDRALLHMDGWEEAGAPGGTTMFRLKRGDGTFGPFDVTAARVTDGDGHLLAVYCRPVDYQLATDEVLQQLLSGGTRADALKPCLDVFAWEFNRTEISIAWFEPGQGFQHVSTGIPVELTGAEVNPGRAWATARDDAQAVYDDTWDLLDPGRAAVARELGHGAYWVVPVPDAGTGIPALVTVWSLQETGRPDAHSYGMTLAQAYIELILRWSAQVSTLNEAARRDPLTNVGNRNTLFDAIDRSTAGGALLFCDLDHFKPVNDAHGHAAGDGVLCEVAQRIEHAVGDLGLVARNGGDEFVVVSPGATVDGAAALAERIRAAVGAPILLGGREVHVGITIGVAHASDQLDEHLLAAADQALLEAKVHARGSVRWAQAAAVSSETSTA